MQTIESRGQVDRKTDDRYWLAAKTYVDRQLQNMRNGGAAPKLSAEDYTALVAKVMRTTKEAAGR